MKTTLDRVQLIGSDIRLRDVRTGATYTAKVWDVKEAYGKVRICVDADGNPWFEPTAGELATVK